MANKKIRKFTILTLIDNQASVVHFELTPTPTLHFTCPKTALNSTEQHPSRTLEAPAKLHPPRWPEVCYDFGLELIQMGSSPSPYRIVPKLFRLLFLSYTNFPIELIEERQRAFLVVAFRVFLQFPFQLAMCFALWAYVAFFSLLSAVYAAPRFNARAGSDEGSPSEPPNKKIKLEPGTQAVKQESPSVKPESPSVKPESPTIKAESSSPPPMNPREVPFGQRDKDFLKALLRRVAREKWGWTEDRIQNLAFEYPDQTHHYAGLWRRYYFKVEVSDYYNAQDHPSGEGSIYLRKRGLRGFIDGKGLRTKSFEIPGD
ncbi:hypothetical protein LENED_005779 [Lentinula edodes]|uniref:Uncharacterized protein n=1 Tax=Lentinula edodes TaxID=5353 RepID=A0A1Q3E9W8_LENED|nr:hypothetical protein LENED_005779 [Lentinula edodes]